MAGVEAIRSGAVIAAAKAVSKSGRANQGSSFEGFLKNSGSASAGKDTAESQAVPPTDGRPAAQDTAYAKESGRKDAKGLQDAKQAKDRVFEEPAEAVEAAAEAYRTELREIVKENLGMDDATLDAALESMGIVLTDLLHPEILQQFVLFTGGGEESTDFLTNEGLMQTFDHLLQALEQFQSDSEKALLPMMETLETPVTLEEFLKQYGLEQIEKEY